MARPRLRGINKKQKHEEIIKCGKDPTYFITNYLRVSHPKKGFIPFRLYPFQEDCLKAFQEHKYNIVNKSRQLGLSTTAAAYSLWMALFQREKNILIIATKLDVAKLFIRKVKANLRSLPEWLILPKVTGDSVKHLEFSNGSRITAVPTSAASARGEALSLLLVDEVAHVENIEELWLSLKPTLAEGGSAILISSPSGVGTLFHKIWVEANENQNKRGEGKNGFYPIELPWTVHPERDEKWFEKEKNGIIQAIGERGIAMEYLCSFASSGDTFIKGRSMDELYTEIQEPIEYVPISSNGKDEAWIFKKPHPNHKYVIGADVARGDGDDFSAFNIIDTNTDEVVVDYKGKCFPDTFGTILVSFGEQYNNALICQERNNVGIGTAIKLKDSGYPNLYYEKFQKNIYMSYTKEDVKNELPGFTTNVNSRIEILMKLADSIRNKKIKLYSKRLYEELQTFIWKGNKPQAQKYYHDDLIMSLAIALNLYEGSGKTQYDSNDMAKAILAGMSRNQQRMNSLTGERTSHTQKSTHTSDGFWALPGKKHQPAPSNAPQKNTIDYNDSQWDPFRWIMDD